MGPDFLYIGCAKAGSGWLYEQLSDHPAFWMPPIKELRVLDKLQHGQRPRHLVRTARKRLEATNKVNKMTRRTREFLRYASQRADYDIDWYLSLFQWKQQRLSGDITPAHATLSREAIAQLVERLPQLRGVLFVRDPVARAWSHLNMAIREGVTKGKDVSEVVGDPEHWPDVRRFLEDKRFAAKSYPSRAYRAWSEHLPADRIFVGFFDELVQDPAALRSRVISFLGANPAQSGSRFTVNHNSKQSKQKLPLPDHIRAEMALFFREELEDCVHLFGGPAKEWAARYAVAQPTRGRDAAEPSPISAR